MRSRLSIISVSSSQIAYFYTWMLLYIRYGCTMATPVFFVSLRAVTVSIIISCLLFHNVKCRGDRDYRGDRGDLFYRGDGILPTLDTVMTTVDDVDETTTNDVYETTSQRCQCNSDLPPVVTCQDYIETGYPERLEAAEREIERLGRVLDDYNQTVIHLHHHLEITGAQLNMTMGTLEGVLEGTVVVTVAELELVKEELAEMSTLLERIEEVASDVSEVQQLREELTNFSEIIAQLEVTRPTEVRLLQRQINDLREKLAECERSYTEISEDDGLFQPWSDFPSQDSCRDIIHVSEPFTVRGRGTKIGAWFRDPLLNYSSVYYAPFHNPRLTFQVDCFANVADFRRGTEYESRYMMPTSLPAQGPGMVAYNGSLYYHVYHTRQIVRYDTMSRRVAATQELPDALINNRGSYSPGSYSDVDIAVDELGLWAIYVASDQTKTRISRLDPETLDTIETWEAPFPKYGAGNCFVVCGKVYCISSFFSHDSTVDLVFETSTNEFRTLHVPFDIRFGEMMSLDYNPQDQKLYGWDNGHQVVYDLTFDPPEPETTSGSRVMPSNSSGRLDLH